MRTLNSNSDKKEDLKSSDRSDTSNLGDDLKTLDSDWKNFDNDLEADAPRKKKKSEDFFDEDEDEFELKPKAKTSFMPIVIGLIVVGGIGAYLFFQSKQTTDTPSNVTSNATSTVTSNNKNNLKNNNSVTNNGTVNNGATNNNKVNNNTPNNNTSNNISEGTLVKEGENGTTTTIENGNNSNENIGSSVGLPDMNKNTGDKTNTSPVTDYSKFVNSFSGKEEAVDYDVNKISTSVDFVNYTKYRSVTGEGTELYWLDATYKDRPYTIVVSYQVFRTLDNSGIVPVNVETVTLKDGEQIVTSISIKTDYDNKNK